MQYHIIILTFLFFNIIACAQTSEQEKNLEVYNNFTTPEIKNFIETYTPSESKVLSINLTSNKKNLILITESASDSFLDNFLKIEYFENLGGQWTIINSIKFAEPEGGAFYKQIDRVKVVKIDSKNHILCKVDNQPIGTAFYGLTNSLFVFYDLEKDSIIKIEYSKGDRQPNGSFSFENGKISDVKQFVEYINKNEIKNEQSKDINAKDNFHLKWLSMNRGIYEKIEEEDKWINVNFPQYAKTLFTSKSLGGGDTLKHNGFIISAGFSSPILLYNEKTERTSVLWIPYAWPTGAGWGARSFNIDSVTEDKIITLKNGFGELFLDFNRKKVKFLGN